MNRQFPLLISLLFSLSVSAQQKIQLSEASTVSLITCGPGEELYEAFGHTAIRVCDSVLQLDLVYNYGTFSFNQSNFYWRFVQGNLLYRLGINRYDNFVDSYIFYNRSVREQILNLTLPQKQAVMDKLMWNSEKENREYLYNYYFDNCSTRPRDIIQEALAGIIKFDSTFLGKERITIRQLTHIYALKQQPWGNLGIDLCLGQRIDQPTTASEYMFLPEELEKAFDYAFIEKNGQKIPLVSKKRVVFKAAKIVAEKDWFVPQVVLVAFLLLCAVLLTIQRARGGSTRIFDGLLFITTSIIGWLALFLWFFTDHYIADNNWNILWALPTNTIFGFALLKKQRAPWTRIYSLFLIFLYAGILIGWNYLPQMLHFSLKFVILLLLFVSVGVFRMSRAKG